MNHALIFDGLQEPVIVVDRDANVHYGNFAAAELLASSPKRLSMGRALDSFATFSAADDSVQTLFDHLYTVTQTTQTIEAKIQCRDGGGAGKESWVQLVVQPQPGGLGELAGDCWIISMHDVTLERTLHGKYRGELDLKEKVIGDLRLAQLKLEEYSVGLETKISDRTRDLTNLNRLFKTILDSLGQGILVFDQDGCCLPVYSKACEVLLGAPPVGRMIEHVLGFSVKQAKDFANWRLAVFEDRIDFEDLVALAPVSLEIKDNTSLAIGYQEMRSEDGVLRGVVVIVTDRTREKKALKRVEEERQFVDKILRLAQNRGPFRMFVRDARTRFQSFSNLGGKDLTELRRDLHTIKGGAASFALKSLAAACHQMEDALAQSMERRILQSYMLNKGLELEKILDGEVARLAEVFGPIESVEEEKSVDVPLSTLLGWSLRLLSLSNLQEARDLGELVRREAVEKPVGSAFGHIEKSLKELAQQQGKRLSDFVISGGETRVPLDPLQPLLTSLIHALRNAVYHGIEKSETRLSLGKAEAGTVSLQFSKHVSGAENTQPWLRIEIKDDGGGIDPSRVRDKLIAIGQEDLARGSDEQVIQAVLLSEFSTNTTVDSTAGRGVGLDAIAEEVRRLGGSITVQSAMKLGTIFTIEIPVPNVWSDSGSRSRQIA